MDHMAKRPIPWQDFVEHFRRFRMMTRRNFIKLSALVSAALTTRAQANVWTQAAWTAPTNPVRLPENTFATLCMHDIRNGVVQDVYWDPYASSARRFLELLDWFKSNHWHCLTVDEILWAVEGHGKLPKNSFHISIDDGLASFYRHVFPALKAYEYSAVHALETNWIDRTWRIAAHRHQDAHLLDKVSAQTAVRIPVLQSDLQSAYRSANLVNAREVDYNGKEEDQHFFVSWDHVREMQHSGLVEFASHTHASHHGVLSNPQGNYAAATITRQYFPDQQRYETDAEFHDRLYYDFCRSRDRIKAEAGTAPRILVWPFGAATQEVNEIAHSAGMPITFSLYSHTLTSVSSDRSKSKDFGRILIVNDPEPMEIVWNIYDVFHGERQIQRVLQVSLDDVYDPSAEQTNKNLGELLDQVLALGVSAVYLQAFADPVGSGNAKSVYFPNRVLPMRADLFNRVAWQLMTRSNVKVFPVMPLIGFTLPDPEKQARLSIRVQTRSGDIVPASRGRRRLSPFLPEVQTIVATLYEDLAKALPSVAGVIIGDDATMTSDEDASVLLPEARWPGSKTTSVPSSNLHFPMNARDRTMALIDFGKAVTTAMHRYTNVSESFSVGRNLYARALTHPDNTEQRFAMAMEPFLNAYDWVALEAMPYLDGTQLPANQWLRKLTHLATAYPGGLERSVFFLQARNWKQHTWISDPQLSQWISLCKDNHALNIGICPDDFIGQHPSTDTIYPDFSLHRFPPKAPKGI